MKDLEKELEKSVWEIIIDLQREIRELEKENKKLKEYNRRLKQGNDDFKEQNKKLKETIKDHKLYEEKLEHRIIEFEELLHWE